jgi:hypothetical protein
VKGTQPTACKVHKFRIKSEWKLAQDSRRRRVDLVSIPLIFSEKKKKLELL